MHFYPSIRLPAMLAGLALAMACVPPAMAQQGQYLVKTDEATRSRVEAIVAMPTLSEPGLSHGERLAQVSSLFLGVPYLADTLVGSRDTREMLVADFNRVDCFTFIDYVEALSRATDSNDFLARLAAIRYADGTVDFRHRRHFFSDWAAVEPRNARDVTRELGSITVSVDKVLNRKADGTEYLPGLGGTPRTIDYIPAAAIDEHVLEQLQTGDYVGAYTPLDGLDVTHVGIVIKAGGQVWFRNASSVQANRKVVDVPLREYMAAKPGMVVLRTH
ncbi:DUF1460 domain-containing protein [Kerstersia similis]|uniref:DUF1460 domain-containing protein n=1 Tax=Kerstersia similis TaxID=206505 RepID=UPI0039EFAC01